MAAPTEQMYRGFPEQSVWSDHGSIHLGKNDIDGEHQTGLFNECDALINKPDKTCVDITNIINIFAHLEPATAARFDDKTWMELKGILKDHAPPGILRPSKASHNLFEEANPKPHKCVLQ